MADSQQPPWVMPAPGQTVGDIFAAGTRLRVLNSLTRTKTPFVPMHGRDVFWYACGPTVYGPSHMGHARTYVCFDVIRRIMRDHFGFRPILIMNITDIDDKIINKANEAGVPFTEIAQRYEAEFLEDMASLGVEPPDEMPRVSEHIPEVISFIETIMERGFAYESEGSVYFDTVAYSAAHPYGKLRPENVGNETSALEGEGALGKAAAADAKKDKCDFALWKAAKEGEPSWSSPWGEGRPGWHIECSTMATEALRRYGTGGVMDIHSGGVDLMFPHHDNEIAQSEACLGCRQWVQYFLHSGHLNIRGQKMSKSLKNFTTIRAALERYPARHLRMLFLLYRYNAPLNYTPEMMDDVAAKDKAISAFFEAAGRALRVQPTSAPTRVGPAAAALNTVTLQVQTEVDEALADDFDTPLALAALLRLVAAGSRYVSGPESLLAAEASDGEAEQSASTAAASSSSSSSSSSSASATSEGINAPTLRRSAAVLTKYFRLFGLLDASLTSTIGPASAAASSSSSGSTDAVVDALAEFRERVRVAGRAGDKAAIFDACDWVRDGPMAAQGIKLEDIEGTSAAASWKRVDAEALLEEVQRRRAAKEESAERTAAAAAAAPAGPSKAELLQVPVSEYLSKHPKFCGMFSAYDASGMPTAAADGSEVSKKAMKKMSKVLAAHKRAREEAGLE